MSRPKTFDPDEALERAMHLFWERGYEGASLRELLEAMEISRQSLYDTFGDKRQLFLRVLSRYRALVSVLIDDHLERSSPTLASLHGFLQYYLAQILQTDRRACLMAMAALELGLRDEEVATHVRDYLESLELAFVRVLRAAARAGELRDDADPVALARSLVTSLMGLSVSARAGLSRTALRQIVTTALSILE
ncbi:MAG: TetR/AcrR family transcriptional regulator [Nannocystaceae bacterium]|nr:TetR/AcrR family transcriptional regulator [Myxococcales bacterium]